MTFLQSIGSVGEYILNKAVGEVEAGACVSEVHKFCTCDFACQYGAGHRKYIYSCFGACNEIAVNTCC